MKHTQSLKKNHLFRRLYHKGNSVVSPFFAVYTLKNNPKSGGQGGKKSGNPAATAAPPQNLLGITVGTKLGNAVVRNRVRRRISAIYRTNEEKILPGNLVVIVARNRCATATYGQMEQSLVKLLGQLGLVEGVKASFPPKDKKTIDKKSTSHHSGNTKFPNNKNNSSGEHKKQAARCSSMEEKTGEKSNGQTKGRGNHFSEKPS